MRDNPLLQSIFDDFEKMMAAAKRHTVGGVPLSVDVDAAIGRIASLHEATPAEIRRWLGEAGMLP